MITPAVLISACGTLIFSTATRLARLVDRVRELSREIERLCAEGEIAFVVERRAETERQLAAHDEEAVRRYIRAQEAEDRRLEQLELFKKKK